MKLWRALWLLPYVVLSGCLVSFKQPIAAVEPLPISVLGAWQEDNEWGEQKFLDIAQRSANQYVAVLGSGDLDNLSSREEYAFTVTRHGARWYVSAQLSPAQGGNFVLGGFELTRKGELVLYGLDVDRVRQAIADKALSGQVSEESTLVTSPIDEVLKYLDDPANADLFSESARYKRAEQ